MYELGLIAAGVVIGIGAVVAYFALAAYVVTRDDRNPIPPSKYNLRREHARQ